MKRYEIYREVDPIDGETTRADEEPDGQWVKWEDHKARVAELGAQYGELIYAVATKFPDETRHQTALRYIQQAENGEASPACELKP